MKLNLLVCLFLPLVLIEHSWFFSLSHTFLLKVRCDSWDKRKRDGQVVIVRLFMGPAGTCGYF